MALCEVNIPNYSFFCVFCVFFVRNDVASTCFDQTLPLQDLPLHQLNQNRRYCQGRLQGLCMRSEFRGERKVINNDEFGRRSCRGRKVPHPTAKVRYSIRTCTDCCIIVKDAKDYALALSSEGKER